ncbi:hypothetical protein [Agrobacterium tumefaciens]|uniref:hypothetical protein n=1 Tax=Agrobacterium tumefaciens TaxID=358 RepID=UPI00287DA96A|nr:hypothetical protein [Agrobacterium tumefaciens]MDS7595400.1 hypothetical protein [Agrobacterium tumefaciens]
MLPTTHRTESADKTGKNATRTVTIHRQMEPLDVLEPRKKIVATEKHIADHRSTRLPHMQYERDGWREDFDFFKSE